MQQRVVFTSVLAAIAGVVPATEPDNDTFPGDTVSDLVITTTLEERECGVGDFVPGNTGPCGQPDVRLAVLDAAGDPTLTDDDSSPFGDGNAPALTGIDLAGLTRLEWLLTGDANPAFLPATPHGELGRFQILVDFFGPDGHFVSGASSFRTFASGDELFAESLTIPPDAATADIIVDNLFNPACPCDTDYYRITGLPDDSSVDVRIDDPMFPVRLAVLGPTGQIQESRTSDMPPVRLSRLRANDGEIYIAVTGIEDDLLVGFHRQSGPYGITIIPRVPCNAADLAPLVGELTFGDIAAFIEAFVRDDPVADFAEPFGVLTFADITAFLAFVAQGCP
jgi:hypothetical protein